MVEQKKTLKDCSERKECFINIFDNITELTSFLSNTPRKPGRDNASEKSDNDRTWSGCKTYEEAFEKLKYGDDDLLEKFSKEKKKISIEKFLGVQNFRSKYENNFFGAIPNVPRFLKGDPMNMINLVQNKPSFKVLNIFLDLSVSASVGIDDIIQNGVFYIFVVDLLEKTGYRCNLYVGDATSFYDNSPCETLCFTRIKTDREPLNIKKICFPIASPGMLRRIHFKWAEVNNFEQDSTNDGYGRCLSKERLKSTLEAFLGEKENFIVWSYNEDGSAMTIEKIIEELKTQGIKINGLN